MIGNTVISIKRPFVEKSSHPFQVFGRGVHMLLNVFPLSKIFKMIPQKQKYANYFFKIFLKCSIPITAFRNIRKGDIMGQS